MGPDTNPRRSVLFTNIGEEKQHQQRPPLRLKVDKPVEIRRDLSARSEACIDVPSRISRIFLARETDGEAHCAILPDGLPHPEHPKSGRKGHESNVNKLIQAVDTAGPEDSTSEI